MVQLLLYDYQMVGQTLGTHTAIVAFEHEYWFSIEGLKKRNCWTKTKFKLDEESGSWVKCQNEDQIVTNDIFSTIHRSVKNLGSVGTHSDRPRRIVHCGETRLETRIREFEEHLRFNLLEKFCSSTYDLRNNNCNNFSREVLIYLKPTDFELGCDTLAVIINKTRETVEGIEQTVQDTVDGAAELAKVAVAAALGGFILGQLTRR